MNNPPKHWSATLQAMAHWVAYKKQYFNGHLLLEGAIIAELTQLLSAKLDFPLRLKCEMMYREIFDQITDQTRTDLVIGKNENDKFIIKEVIEVKRYEVNKKVDNFDKIQEDMEKLYLLSKIANCPRLFLVVIGQHKLPSKLFGELKGMKRSNVYEGQLPFEAKPIMSRKAINKSDHGAFGLLIEIVA